MKQGLEGFFPHGELDPKIKSFIIFWQTIREVSKYIDSYLLKTANVSTIQFIVLHMLETNDGIMKPSEIASWTNTVRHNITTLIRRMEKQGLIDIKRVDHTKKNVRVVITDKGRLSIKNATPVVRRVIEQVMSSMLDEDVTPFQRTLISMRKNISDEID